MRSFLRSWWTQPRAPENPGRVWWDKWLVTGVVLSAILEGIFRPDVLWRPFAILMAVSLALTLLWRRTHPLIVVAIVFGTTISLNVLLLIDPEWELGLFTMAFLLLLPYSLLRWGSGREAIFGLGFIWLTYVLTIPVANDLAEIIGGGIVLALPAVIGAEVRAWHHRRSRQTDQIRLLERELLARELHDTVAHHVSAIAVQAQAGRALAQTDPKGALETLSTIEEEASRTLTEMRTMVGALRHGEEPDLGPQRGVADLNRLAVTAPDAPPVEVEILGELQNLQPAVQSAIYRLAQESITNAVRHAREATKVSVEVVEEDSQVRLTVRDDGSHAAHPADPGYGLIGMEERATLLGGTFQAGPMPSGGWKVVAVIPKNGTAG
ncbi:MAG: sensor histidine kinase [Acidimicrobiia bacterium]